MAPQSRIDLLYVWNATGFDAQKSSQILFRVVKYYFWIKFLIFPP